MIGSLPSTISVNAREPVFAITVATVTKVQSRSVPGLSLNTILAQTRIFRTLLLGDPRAILSTAKRFKLRNSIHKQVPQNPLHISSIWRTCDLRDQGQILLATVCTETLLLSQGTRAEESYLSSNWTQTEPGLELCWRLKASWSREINKCEFWGKIVFCLQVTSRGRMGMQYLWGEDWSKNWMESGRRGRRRKNWPASELTHQLSNLTVWLHNWIMHKTNVMVHLFLVLAATTAAAAAAAATTTTTGDLSNHLLHLSLDNCWTIWWWPRNCCTTCICCPSLQDLFWSTLFGLLFGFFGDLGSGKIRGTNYILQHFSLTLQFFSLNLCSFSNLILATNWSFSLFFLFCLYQILLS